MIMLFFSYSLEYIIFPMSLNKKLCLVVQNLRQFLISTFIS